MKAERIWDALGQVDDKFIEELAETPDTVLSPRRKLRLVLIAAAVLVLLTACAVKIVDLAWEDGWFADFFSEKTGMEAAQQLNPNQMQVLQEGLTPIGKGISCEGYTVTLESALSDGYRAFAKFIVEAPEGIALDAQRYYLNLRYQVCHADGSRVKLPVSYTGVKCLEDHDPADNRVTMLMETVFQTSGGSGQLLEKGMVWSIQLSGFGIDHGRGEQEALVEMEETLTVEFDENILLQQEVEVLRKPLWCRAERGFRQWKIPVRVKVISFRLRALSATLTFQEPLLGYGEQGTTVDTTYVVMKDGTRIEAHFSMGGNHGDTWEESLEFSVPIAVADVDYVEFPGKQVVPVDAG